MYFRSITNRGRPKCVWSYAISRLIHSYLDQHGLRYDHLNDAIGILQCVQLELYRSIAGPYEDIKLEENGSIGIL